MIVNFGLSSLNYFDLDVEAVLNGHREVVCVILH